MREKRSLKNFIMGMSALCLSLIILWCVFYFLTIRNVRENAGIQANAQSEAILSRIEKELQEIEEIKYSLAHNECIYEMCRLEDIQSFMDYGSLVMKDTEDVLRGEKTVGNIILFGKDNFYYRLRGECSNTILAKVKNYLDRGEVDHFILQGNGESYIGSSRPVMIDGEIRGYVTLILDKSSIEYIFADYSDVDYMGIILMADGQILCADRQVSVNDIETIKTDSVIYKEQRIGLTGLSLLVYCENTISKELRVYFYIALPVLILLLALVFAFYIAYWNRTTLGPQERELLESRMRVQEVLLENERTMTSLLKKQISAHFTVNTLTAVRALINKGKKEEATQMCDELSWLLRYSNAPEEKISLMDEFYVLEQYVGIMQVRYPNRIEYNAELEDYFEECFIPRMLLQPILENAIVHGMSGREKISLTVKTFLSEDLIIQIEDDGNGIDREKLKSIRNRLEHTEAESSGGIKGVALENIQKRIRIACGEGYGLKIESEPGEGSRVTVRLKKFEHK